jgi:hypothetical protein
VWKVVGDSSGKKVLAQTSDQGPNGLFNLCLAEKTPFTDIDLTVAFKAVAGKLDQGGGPVRRYKDTSNYYVVGMPLFWTVSEGPVLFLLYCVVFWLTGHVQGKPE